MADSTLVDIGELLLVEGASLHVVRDVELDAVASSTSQLRHEVPVHVDVTLFGSQGELTAVGVVEFVWQGECRRCLEQVSGTASVDVEEVFTPTAVAGEDYELAGDGIDLGPLVNDAVALSLPLGPLCDEACPGPQPDRFPVKVVSDDEPPALDPRWAALDELKFDD